MKNILFHVCCAPCSTVLSSLKAGERGPLSTFFYNPNIQPEGEYEQRSATFDAYAAGMGIKATEGPYEPELWIQAVGDTGGIFPLIEGDPHYVDNREKRQIRCRACYACRFDKLAAQAKAGGFTAIATTLSVSPYQFLDIIKEELQTAAQNHGIESAFIDFHELYPETVRTSRALGMYRQNYCGCLYSKKEAELERAARAEARKQAKQARKAAKDTNDQ
jgi:predicted adenine nucleotide alpha hydrolase (AANH) superfamily ATPase